MLDPASVAVGAAIVPLMWVGSKFFGSLRNHAHRDRGVRGLKVKQCVESSGLIDLVLLVLVGIRFFDSQCPPSLLNLSISSGDPPDTMRYSSHVELVRHLLSFRWSSLAVRGAWDMHWQTNSWRLGTM